MTHLPDSSQDADFLGPHLLNVKSTYEDMKNKKVT